MLRHSTQSGQREARAADRAMPDGLRQAPLHAAAAVPSGDLLTLPNAITLARLCLVPAVVWLVVRGQLAIAFWGFAVAGLSDAVDGWIARRRGPSALGTLLDPVADKVLLVSLYVALAAIHVLPDWLAILVVFRDLVIVGGVLALSFLGHTVAIRPLPISKVNTTLQILLVMAALLHTGYGIGHRGGAGAVALAVLVWLVAASTLASGAAYVWQRARPR